MFTGVLRSPLVLDQGVGGSNPLVPTFRINARFGMAPKRALDVFVDEISPQFHK